MPKTVYSIKLNRLKRSYGEGFSMDEDAYLYPDEQEMTHRLYIGRIDGADPDAEWGRLFMYASLAEEQVLYIYAYATNEQSIRLGEEEVDIDAFLTSENVSDKSKKLLLTQEGSLRFVGKHDVLLYGLKGRYLHLCIEVIGEGGGSVGGIRVERGSDQFMEAFPEIYRSGNDFFHRYISVFNSLYNDFDGNIDRLPELLDPAECPDVLLPVYAGWLGIDVQGDFIPPDALRVLVSESYALNRMKGTKACLARILDIVLDEPAIILEANQMREYSENPASEDDIFDVTVLVKKQLSENERYQLLYLLEQFVPVRCNLKLEIFRDSGILDNRVYLDMNAQVAELDHASLDEFIGLDAYTILEE